MLEACFVRPRQDFGFLSPHGTCQSVHVAKRWQISAESRGVARGHPVSRAHLYRKYMLYKKETEIRLYQVVPNHASTEVSKKSFGFKTFKNQCPKRFFLMQKQRSGDKVVHQRMSKCSDAHKTIWNSPCTMNRINQWTNQQIDESKRQISETTKQRSKESIKQWNNESIKQRSNDSMNRWLSGFRSRWVTEPMNYWSKKTWINKSTKQWSKGAMNESMNEWIQESLSQWTNELLKQKKWINPGSNEAGEQ